MTGMRKSGIILHPSSLPGPDGIGDLGPEAYHWIDFLAETGCSLWQVLPLGPTGYGDSPYQCFSAFAGNPYLVSPLMLIKDGLLDVTDLADRPQLSFLKVEYGDVIPWKLEILDKAYNRFKKTRKQNLLQAFDEFQTRQSDWLANFALFMTIKESFGGLSWDKWSTPYRQREKVALDKFKSANEDAIQRQIFRQFIFYRQWSALKVYANSKNIQIIGDIPIFVAFDSADVWSHPGLFFLDKQGKPTVVAGVPPDYFSPTGQLWGNPLYRWSVHKKTNYEWWLKRIKSTLQLFDFIRLDHFRGFAAYWEIPAGSLTAERGRWVKGPGTSFLQPFKNPWGACPSSQKIWARSRQMS